MLARLRLLQEILGLSGSLPLSDPDSAELLSEALRSGRLLSATLSPHTAAAWRRCAASLVAWIDSLQLPLPPAARRLESLLALCRAALLRLIDRLSSLSSTALTPDNPSALLSFARRRLLHDLLQPIPFHYPVSIFHSSSFSSPSSPSSSSHSSDSTSVAQWKWPLTEEALQPSSSSLPAEGYISLEMDCLLRPVETLRTRAVCELRCHAAGFAPFSLSAALFDQLLITDGFLHAPDAAPPLTPAMMLHARAKQFCGFAMLLGHVDAGGALEVRRAVLVKNQDKLYVPLHLDAVHPEDDSREEEQVRDKKHDDHDEEEEEEKEQDWDCLQLFHELQHAFAREPRLAVVCLPLNCLLERALGLEVG
ncbi:MAG: hypothetical protein Q8P67_15260, partial [archaeon]|nr:hypothetical protein [archaeon]